MEEEYFDRIKLEHLHFMDLVSPDVIQNVEDVKESLGRDLWDGESWEIDDALAFMSISEGQTQKQIILEDVEGVREELGIIGDLTEEQVATFLVDIREAQLAGVRPNIEIAEEQPEDGTALYKQIDYEPSHFGGSYTPQPEAPESAASSEKYTSGVEGMELRIPDFMDRILKRYEGMPASAFMGIIGSGLMHTNLFQDIDFSSIRDFGSGLETEGNMGDPEQNAALQERIDKLKDNRTGSDRIDVRKLSFVDLRGDSFKDPEAFEAFKKTEDGSFNIDHVREELSKDVKLSDGDINIEEIFRDAQRLQTALYMVPNIEVEIDPVSSEHVYYLLEGLPDRDLSSPYSEQEIAEISQQAEHKYGPGIYPPLNGEDGEVLIFPTIRLPSIFDRPNFSEDLSNDPASFTSELEVEVEERSSFIDDGVQGIKQEPVRIAPEFDGDILKQVMHDEVVKAVDRLIGDTPKEDLCMDKDALVDQVLAEYELRANSPVGENYEVGEYSFSGPVSSEDELYGLTIAYNEMLAVSEIFSIDASNNETEVGSDPNNTVEAIDRPAYEEYEPAKDGDLAPPYSSDSVILPAFSDASNPGGMEDALAEFNAPAGGVPDTKNPDALEVIQTTSSNIC